MAVLGERGEGNEVWEETAAERMS